MKAKRVKKTKEAITSDLRACKSIFDKTGIPWVIIDGIVLGYFRNKAILPWDTDVDIAVFDLLPDQWSILKTAFQHNKFQQFSRRGDFVYGKRCIKLNLWIYHKKGEYYEARPNPARDLKFVEKAEWYDEIQLVDFLGSTYPMPNNLEDYIICRYGKDWRIEKRSHDKWRLEKFGSAANRFKPEWLRSRCSKSGDLWPKVMKIGDML